MKVIGTKHLPCHGQPIKAFSDGRIVRCRRCGAKWEMTVKDVPEYINGMTGMDGLVSASVREIKD